MTVAELVTQRGRVIIWRLAEMIVDRYHTIESSCRPTHDFSDNVYVEECIDFELRREFATRQRPEPHIRDV